MWRTNWMIVLAAGLLAAGCARKSAPPPSPIAVEESPLKIFRPAPVINPSTLLDAGLPPLVYLCDGGGAIRIVNATTRQTVLRTTVEPRTIISVDPKAGILVGGEKLARGPLPQGHRFEIWLDPQPPQSGGNPAGGNSP